ncbi:MAG: isoleucine--tRNA ligase [Phycisphaerae bacterium]|nr:isoleucine--tRNA ligase [Phycisphaerae bacterium]
MFPALPSKFDFPAAERAVRAFWERERIFERSLEQRRASNAGRFVFYEGPPTANGLPHPGHALTRAIKDLFPRYQTMCGKLVDRKAGWDTHGLPVEVEVCKELGIHTKEEIEAYGVEKFNLKCIQSVFRYTKQWEEMTKRLGFWVNLDEAYVTYHQSYVESVWWGLKQLFDRGLLYQGHKVVWWWAQGGTALSSGEVGEGYRTVDDPSVYVKFPVQSKSASKSAPRVHGAQYAGRAPHESVAGADGRTSLLVWTTTPWTLLSNHFAAVHPELDYALVEDPGDGTHGAEYLYVAAALVEGLAKKVRRELKTVATCKGADLVGLRYVPPLPEVYYARVPSEYFELGNPHVHNAADAPLGERVEELRAGGDEVIGWRVIAADFVTIDSGTGLVHEAPAFGEVDFQALQRERERFAGFDAIPLFCAVAPNGQFDGSAPEKYRGRWVKDCDKDIIRELKERKTPAGSPLLLHQEQISHEYPFCPRAENDALIQYARKSWFVRTSQFKDDFLANNAKVNWLPDHIRDGRFGDFLRNNVDWALSRERYWGTPLPIWRCETTGKMEAIGSFAELRAKPGATDGGYWEKKVAEHRGEEFPEHLRVHKPYIDEWTYDSPHAPGARMRRVTEVIDCWWDAGSMPFAQWGYPHVKGSTQQFEQRFPADFISEAIDQTRGWFYGLLSISTLLFSTGVGFPRPFKTCIVLGHMMGEDGLKMSKRKKNYKEPSYIFDMYGADAMRWYFYAAQAPWTTSRFQEANIRDAQRDFLVRLYNVFSFFNIYANIDGFNAGDGKAPGRGWRKPAERGELDRWILSEMHRTIAFVREKMDAFENYPAAQRLNDFVDALSNWYVRRSRDRFWSAIRNSAADQDKWDAYNTLYDVLLALSKLIAPFTPFFADVMYANLTGRDVLADGAAPAASGGGAPASVHLCDYPAADRGQIDESLADEMDLVREIVSAGRAARTDAKLKVRQPLARVEIILARHEHEQWLQSHAPLIAEELNVKAVEFATSADQYVTYQIKPNFKALGPKFGKLAPQIGGALQKIDAAASRRALSDAGKFSLAVGGQTVELTSEEVEIRLEAKPGWAAAQSRAGVVVLSTEITDALREEGMVRELIHHVQALRKDMDLPYEQRIRLRLSGPDALRSVASKFAAMIGAECLVESLDTTATAIPDGHAIEVEGHAGAIAVERV